MNRRKSLLTLIFSLLLLLPLGSIEASIGTPLMLSSGQELRLDIPLKPDRTYEVKINLRTDLPSASVTVRLEAIRQNNEVVVLGSTTKDLTADGQWNQVILADIRPEFTAARWELVLETKQEGRYYWQGLSVTRVQADQSVEEFWQEKLAQGPFFTGLVVDARGLDVRRGMSPKIYSEQGQLIYGGVLAPADLVQERGVVIYGTELTEELVAQLQVDPNFPYAAPLIIKATGVADPARTSVYIDQADTAKVLAAMVQYDFFARYAVIFLVD